MSKKKINFVGSEYYSDEELKSFNFKSLGKSVLIGKHCTIVNMKGISIGDNVRIDNFSILIGGENKKILKIGKNVHISSFCFLNGSDGISLADYSGLGLGVKIFSKNDDFSGQGMTNPTVAKKQKKIISGQIKIGTAVNIGVNSTILPNSNVGNYSSIGSYTLVKGNLKSSYVYFGIPAKPLYKKFDNIKILRKKIKS